MAYLPCDRCGKEVGETANAVNDDARPIKGKTTLKSLGDDGEPTLATSPRTTLTNQIKGIKDCFVLFLKYRSEKHAKSDINLLIEDYKLGDIFIVETIDNVVAIAPKVFSHKRLLKIIKASKSINKKQQEKFGRIFMKMPVMKLLDAYIENKVDGQISKPHYLYLCYIFIMHFGLKNDLFLPLIFYILLVVSPNRWPSF